MLSKDHLPHLAQAKTFVDGLPDDLQQYSIDSKKVDALLNHGINSGADKGTVLRFANTTLHRELGSDVGNPISDDDYIYAHQNGFNQVKAGAVNMGRQIIDMHHNPQSDNVVAMTSNTVKNPDGTMASYEEPWTDSSGNVRQFPAQELKNKAMAAGHLADSLDRMHTMLNRYPTKQDLSGIVDSHVNAINSQDAPAADAPTTLGN